MTKHSDYKHTPIVPILFPIGFLLILNSANINHTSNRLSRRINSFKDRSYFHTTYIKKTWESTVF